MPSTVTSSISVLVEELVQIELAFPALVAAGQPARAGLDRRLEPPPLALQGVPA
jgi:hypothetical protein